MTNFSAVRIQDIHYQAMYIGPRTYEVIYDRIIRPYYLVLKSLLNRDLGLSPTYIVPCAINDDRIEVAALLLLHNGLHRDVDSRTFCNKHAFP